MPVLARSHAFAVRAWGALTLQRIRESMAPNADALLGTVMPRRHGARPNRFARPDMNIRIGAVNYLNTKPLIHELDDLAPHAELVLEVPSRLADMLADGQL